ncbi:response regulator transcription factor [Amycolatopsis marina]|uniref:response regulator transcription factor n=1 Tax=Amycolatopsis marina TaxID=490629 RepID=UPI003CCC333E
MARSASNREIEILMLVATGANGSEIADKLHISNHTVKSHIKSLRRKLCARDRAHLVALAFHAGLLDVNSPMGGCRESR